jgi:hypothetical protein
MKLHTCVQALYLQVSRAVTYVLMQDVQYNDAMILKVASKQLREPLYPTITPLDAKQCIP